MDTLKVHELSGVDQTYELRHKAPDASKLPAADPSYGRPSRLGPTAPRNVASKVTSNPAADRRISDAHEAASQPKIYDLPGSIKLKIAGGFIDGRVSREIERTKNYCDIDALDYAKNKLTTQGAVVVDIGAGSGNHSVFFASVENVKAVHAFESDQRLADTLAENIAANVEIGKKIQLRRINLGSRHNFHDFQRPGDAGKIDQPSTLDQQNLEIDRIDVLRIGRGSFNPQLLEGCEETVKKLAPSIIWVEAPHNGRIFSKTAEKLTELGYSEGQKLGQVTLFEKI